MGKGIKTVITQTLHVLENVHNGWNRTVLVCRSSDGLDAVYFGTACGDNESYWFKILLSYCTYFLIYFHYILLLIYFSDILLFLSLLFLVYIVAGLFRHDIIQLHIFFISFLRLSLHCLISLPSSHQRFISSNTVHVSFFSSKFSFWDLGDNPSLTVHRKPQEKSFRFCF